jgi:hypothetical protein
VVARACRLAGLITGPVHAEVRVNDEGIWILEIAGALDRRSLRACAHAFAGNEPWKS